MMSHQQQQMNHAQFYLNKQMSANQVNMDHYRHQQQLYQRINHQIQNSVPRNINDNQPQVMYNQNNGNIRQFPPQMEQQQPSQLNNNYNLAPLPSELQTPQPILSQFNASNISNTVSRSIYSTSTGSSHSSQQHQLQSPQPQQYVNSLNDNINAHTTSTPSWCTSGIRGLESFGSQFRLPLGTDNAALASIDNSVATLSDNIPVKSAIFH